MKTLNNKQQSTRQFMFNRKDGKMYYYFGVIRYLSFKRFKPQVFRKKMLQNLLFLQSLQFYYGFLTSKIINNETITNN